MKKNTALAIIILVSLAFDLSVLALHKRTPPKNADFKEAFFFRPYGGDGRIFTARAINTLRSSKLIDFDSASLGPGAAPYFSLPSYRVAPLYPALIALAYKLCGAGYFWLLILVQMAFKSLTAALIFLLFMLLREKFRLPLKPAFGFIAAILYALWLPAGVYVHYYPVYSETLATLLVTACVYSALRSAGSAKYLPWIATGICSAAVILTREPWLLFPFAVVAGLLFIAGLPKKIVLRQAAVYLVTVLLCVAPLTVFNYMRHRAFIPVASSGFGWDQWADYSTSRYGTGFNAASLVSPEEKKKILYKEGERSTDVAYQRELFAKAMKQYLGHPLRFAAGKLKYLYRMWIYGNPPPLDLPVLSLGLGSHPRILSALALLLSLPMLIAAAAGVCCYLKYWRLFILLFSGVWYMAWANLFFHYEFRYSLPAWPLLFLAAGMALNRAYKK